MMKFLETWFYMNSYTVVRLLEKSTAKPGHKSNEFTEENTSRQLLELKPNIIQTTKEEMLG